MKETGRDYEIIVVDDGSTGPTAARACGCGARILHLDRNQGYGAALKAGICRAKFDWILIIDADLTYPRRRFRACSSASRSTTWRSARESKRGFPAQAGQVALAAICQLYRGASHSGSELGHALDAQVGDRGVPAAFAVRILVHEHDHAFDARYQIQSSLRADRLLQACGKVQDPAYGFFQDPCSDLPPDDVIQSGAHSASRGRAGAAAGRKSISVITLSPSIRARGWRAPGGSSAYGERWLRAGYGGPVGPLPLPGRE